MGLPGSYGTVVMADRLIPTHTVLMASLFQIRNVPDDVRRRLKASAAAQGESLNGYLLRLVERDVARPTVAEVLDRAAARAGRADASAFDALETVRREREHQVRARPGS